MGGHYDPGQAGPAKGGIARLRKPYPWPITTQMTTRSDSQASVRVTQPTNSTASKPIKISLGTISPLTIVRAVPHLALIVSRTSEAEKLLAATDSEARSPRQNDMVDDDIGPIPAQGSSAKAAAHSNRALGTV
ncbi:hypothetical protein LTR95_000630 [Oleoguttula sp. CCFEE 5521]